MGVLAGIAAVVAAIGMGIYVYPQRPWLVWTLLFFCWLCYRLKMRAHALYSQRSQRLARLAENEEAALNASASAASTDRYAA
jgi:hypothetical protein